MIAKLKYVGLGVDDLIDVYKLFIRSCMEYCSVAFHSSLTINQSEKFERIKNVLGYNETYLIISYFLEISNCPPNSAPPRRGLKHNFKETYVAQISGLTKGFYQDVMKNFVII